MNFKQFLFNAVRSFHSRPYNLVPQSLGHEDATVPFICFLRQHSGRIMQSQKNYLRRNYPKLLSIGESDIKMTVNVLKKFHIDTQHALKFLELFEMNPTTMENYGTILTECGFSEVEPMHLIRYLKLSRSRTIEQLKCSGLIPMNLDLKQKLMECFEHWPNSFKILDKLDESSTSICAIRLKVLQKYLEWRLSMTEMEFNKFLKANTVAMNRSMASIQESLHIAESVIRLDADAIKKHHCVICADPNNVKCILAKCDKIAGIDMATVMKIIPNLFCCQYKSILGVKKILENVDNEFQKYGIPDEAQVKGLCVYCVKPETLEQRIKSVQESSHYSATTDSYTLLSMILKTKNTKEAVEKIKLSRVKKCQENIMPVRKKKRIASPNKKEIPVFICANLPGIELSTDKDLIVTETQNHVNFVREQLKRHQNFKNSPKKNIVETITLLKELLKFSDIAIYNNCQLLLYPSSKIKSHIESIQAIHITGTSRLQTPSKTRIYQEFHGLNYSRLPEDQILSLVLYVIEKEFNFSGDGIWDSVPDDQDCSESVPI